MQPEPRDDEHQHHVGKSKAKPTRKVDNAAVFFKNTLLMIEREQMV